MTTPPAARASRQFQVIPVLDLMGGRVVHARQGERDSYQPIRSRLTGSSEPGEVLRTLRTLHPFTTIYVADLDAIRGQGHHRDVLMRLREGFPEVTFWVDAGFAGAEACQSWIDVGIRDLVLGSESQVGLAGYRETLAGIGRSHAILSLDFSGDTPLGPAELGEKPELWPDRVILMTLSRVGADTGPDFERLTALQSRAPGKRIFAAGGVRGLADLEELAAMGISGALVATALHDGRIGAAELARLS